MLEPLIDRQDDQLAGAAQAALHQDAGEVRLGAGIVAFVIGKDLLDLGSELHGCGPSCGRRGSNAESAEGVHTAPAKNISIGLAVAGATCKDATAPRRKIGRASCRERV